MQCLQTAHREERIERPQNAADSVVQIRKLFRQLTFFARDHHAADHIGVAVQILGDRMYDQIEAVIEWPLDIWSSEGVIRDGNQFVFLCDGSNCGKIDQFQ